MGDRANIRLIQPNNKGSIYIYTHSMGYSLPGMLQTALESAQGRWDDVSYFNRIIIDQITRSGRDSETGFGVGLEGGDNAYNVLEVDIAGQTVQVRSQIGYFDNPRWEMEGNVIAGPIPYADYIVLDDANAWRDKA